MVPAYVAAVSLLIFFVNVIVAKRQAKKSASPAAARTSPDGHEIPGGTVTAHSPVITPSSAFERVIIATNAVRLAACAGLTVFSIFTVLSATGRGASGFEWDLGEVDVPLLAIFQAIVFVRRLLIQMHTRANVSSTGTPRHTHPSSQSLSYGIPWASLKSQPSISTHSCLWNCALMDIGIFFLSLLGRSYPSIGRKGRCFGRRWHSSYLTRLLSHYLFRGNMYHLILW
jgi:hypothetical protein